MNHVSTLCSANRTIKPFIWGISSSCVIHGRLAFVGIMCALYPCNLYFPAFSFCAIKLKTATDAMKSTAL